MAETLPGYHADIWYGVVAPVKTPSAIISRLNAEIVRQLQSEHVKAKLEAVGSDIIANSPADFATPMRPIISAGRQ